MTWRKSTFSTTNGGACVEVARTPAAAIAVRDSQDPHGPVLAFTPADWQDFIGQIKSGRPIPA